MNTMTFEAFLDAPSNFKTKLEDLITNIFRVNNPDTTDPDYVAPNDKLAVFSDIKDYLLNRYSSFEMLYPDSSICDRLLCAMLQTNALELTKLVMVWRNAYLEYEQLLIGDSASNSTSISYTGLNATGTYTTTANDAKSVNVFDTLYKMVNSAQNEIYLFLDRMIQPYLKIVS